MMNMPSFPMAGLLTFWGGAENGFWAFDHEPVVYASEISCPVLLMYGEKDPKVSRSEIDEIYANFTGPKELVTFPEAGHENYLNQYRLIWRANVSKFMNANSPLK
jgi:pimeloyl-ACP methyl ester carboxylesterase